MSLSESDILVLSSIAALEALPPNDRLGLSERLASALGDAYSSHPKLIGRAQLPAVIHPATELVFVAIPGGEFTMGLRDDERADLKHTVLGDDPKHRFESQILRYSIPLMLPAHPVKVRPFLCATVYLTKAGRAIDESYRDDPSASLVEAAKLVATMRAQGQRLLSEAEWEWVVRLGGKASWMIDVGTRQGMALDGVPDAFSGNEWGIRFLQSPQGEYVADGWHETYVGAPSDSRAWDPDPSGTPGVHRGAHDCWQDALEAVAFHGAARGRAGEFGVLRPAIDLPLQ